MGEWIDEEAIGRPGGWPVGRVNGAGRGGR